MTIYYNTNTNTIELSSISTDIQSISININNVNIIEETTPKEFLLKSNILILPDSTLTINDTTVNKLKILSDGTNNIIYNITNKGTLNINNVEIGSWNVRTSSPDITTPIDVWYHKSTPRSYIVAAFNTVSHAEITNSRIHDLGYSWGWIEVFYPWYIDKNTGTQYQNQLIIDTGITFYNSSNNIFSNNTVFNMKMGVVFINNSNDNTCSDNTFHDNLNDGIFIVHYSNNNIITDNISYNSAKWNGIELLYQCNNNTIQRNTVYNNASNGIYLQGSCMLNNIENNISYSNNVGIICYGASNNNIINNNNIHDCNLYGIEISFSLGNNININIIKNNNWDGIKIDASSNNIVQRNIISDNNRNGIIIESIQYNTWNYSSNNIIKNNLLTSNKLNGIYQYYTQKNIIENNNILNNLNNGINNVSSTLTTAKNNIIINNLQYGVTGNELNISYSNLYNNILGDYNSPILAGIGSISADPLFIDISNKDFHLKSINGHWNGTTWTNDTLTSPCINAGDPSSDNSKSPFGGIIEMGTYGNTPESSNNQSCPIPICNINITQI